MGASYLLLAGYLGLAGILFLDIARKDIFFAVFFGFLVLYSAPAMLGYVFFPELSAFGGMYFGKEVIAGVIAFTIASLGAVYLCFRMIYMPVIERTRVRLIKFPSVRPAVLVILSLLLAAQIAYFFLYARELNYITASDEEVISALGLEYKFIYVEFKCSSFYIVAMYGLCVLGAGWQTINKIPLLVLLVLHLAVFSAICLQLGDRADILEVLLGATFVEVMRGAEPASSDFHSWPGRVLGYVKRQTWGLVISGVLLLTILMSALEYLRDPSAPVPSAPLLAQKLLLNDYYFPYHMLILTIATDYVDPTSVFISNGANSLAFLNVPYLQYFVADHGEVGRVTRSSSMALYIFTEGFVAAGWLGFIYNGVVIASLLTVWRLFSKTSDRRINIMAGALFVALAASIVRGQTSYFIKCLYLYVLPTLILFGLSLGRMPFGIRFVHKTRTGH